MGLFFEPLGRPRLLGLLVRGEVSGADACGAGEETGALAAAADDEEEELDEELLETAGMYGWDTDDDLLGGVYGSRLGWVYVKPPPLPAACLRISALG